MSQIQTDLEEFVPPGSVNRNPMPRTKRNADKAEPDFFPTPAWATQALLAVESFDGEIWEPACGHGDMSEVLIAAGHAVYSSDLYDRGYGKGEHDFLDSNRRADNIITNPPFKKADQFVRQACRLASKKVAMFLPITFLSGITRQKKLYRAGYVPTRVWIFSERPTLYKAGAEKKGAGVTTYAWFIFEMNKPAVMRPEIDWIPLGLKPRKKRATKKREIN